MLVPQGWNQGLTEYRKGSCLFGRFISGIHLQLNWESPRPDPSWGYRQAGHCDTCCSADADITGLSSSWLLEASWTLPIVQAIRGELEKGQLCHIGSLFFLTMQAQLINSELVLYI